MISIRAFIENEADIWDDNVFVDFKLPCVPEVGSILHLTTEIENELENKCLNSSTKENYYPRYFFNKGTRLSFSDCVTVKYVKYVPNDEKIYITLSE